MMHRPFAGPSSSAVRTAYEPVATEAQDYPSIDEFLDVLPPIEEFLAAEPVAVEAAPVQPGEEWLGADWKSVNVRVLSEIARRTPVKPSRATPAVPQPEALSEALSAPGPSAEEVAAALDGIARSIRSGELVIDNLNGMKPEAAMAAAIAAILRMRG